MYTHTKTSFCVTDNAIWKNIHLKQVERDLLTLVWAPLSEQDTPVQCVNRTEVGGWQARVHAPV